MLEKLLQEAEEAKSAGNDEHAAQLYKQAIQICESDESQSHHLAICLQELVALYAQHGQLDDAIALLHKLIDIGQKVLGENNPDVIATLANLGRVFAINGQYDEADQVFKLATSKAESALGIAHSLSQQIRQEHQETLANRELVEKDKITHGLILGRASQTNSGTQSSRLSPFAEQINTEALSVPPAAKKEEARPMKKYSNLKQSTKIKKLRYVAESAEEQANSLLKPHNLRHRWRDLFYIVSVILCIAAIVIALSKLFVPRELSDSNLIARQLIEKGVFKSVDDVNGINFIDNKYAVFTNDVRHRKIPYFLLKGGMNDLWDMFVSMATRKESWYQLKPDELRTEDGNIYYANGAPELLLVKEMQALADFARCYYAQNGCYPDKSDKLKDGPGLAYINPITNKADLPVIKRLSAAYSRDAIFPGVKVDAKVEDCYKYLRQGGLWRDDLAAPGKITALGLFTAERCADGYRVVEFYIHGFDRYGNLITAGKSETFYALALCQGRNLYDFNREQMQEMERVSVHPPERIYVVPGDIVDLHFWRQCGATVLTAWTLISFLGWVFFESKKRKENPKRKIQLIEGVFLASLLIWGYIGLIHILP